MKQIEAKLVQHCFQNLAKTFHRDKKVNALSKRKRKKYLPTSTKKLKHDSQKARHERIECICITIE